MLKAKATFSTPSVQSWLTSADETASVVSIHRRSCNLMNGTGCFLTLAVPEVGPGPFTMVLEMADPGHNDLKQIIDIDDQIIINKKFLVVGQVIVRTDQSKNWNPLPDWGKFHNFVDRSWIGLLQQFVMTNAPASSYAFLLGEYSADPFYTAAKKGRLLLEYGLEEGSLPKFLKGVDLLAGLGIGMTPAGDDFLLGVIYALWMNLAPSEARDWSAGVHRLAASRTTSFSAYWLEVAAQGQASKPWHDLLKAIYEMNDLRTRQAARSLSSYGHTSGFDALAGFILASTNILILGSEFD